MTKMPKILTALAAAAIITVAAVATPQPAEARGGRIAGAIIGGLAVGALLGAAGAYGGYYGYGPGYYYAPGPAYYGYGPACYWSRHRVWDGYAWRLQRVRVCG
jgi:hypothetical protein